MAGGGGLLLEYGQIAAISRGGAEGDVPAFKGPPGEGRRRQGAGMRGLDVAAGLVEKIAEHHLVLADDVGEVAVVVEPGLEFPQALFKTGDAAELPPRQLLQ